jgi:drug/metabolite transporter (DMT)-like permease
MLNEHKASTTVFGSSLIILSTIFYGSYGVWTRLMGNSFGPFMQAWIRAALIIAILYAISVFTKQSWQRVRWRDDKWWLIAWILGSWFIGGPLFYAYNRLGIGVTTLIFYSGYLMSMFMLGWLVNHERFSFDKLLATLLALTGLVLISAPTVNRAALLPLCASLLAGWGIGIDLVVSQHVKYNSLQTSALAWAAGMVGSLPMAFLLHERTPGLHDVSAWAYLLIFVLACIAASWLAVHGVKLIEAGAAGLMGMLEIVWAVLFGILFFHERPHFLAYAGAILIVAAAAIPYAVAHKTVEERTL